jgi:hypothetical protein
MEFTPSEKILTKKMLASVSNWNIFYWSVWPKKSFLHRTKRFKIFGKTASCNNQIFLALQHFCFKRIGIILFPTSPGEKTSSRDDREDKKTVTVVFINEQL